MDLNWAYKAHFQEKLRTKKDDFIEHLQQIRSIFCWVTVIFTVVFSFYNFIILLIHVFESGKFRLDKGEIWRLGFWSIFLSSFWVAPVILQMAGQNPNMDQFEAYFKRADLDGDGRISGAEAVGFFQGSGLPKQVLAQVTFLLGSLLSDCFWREFFELFRRKIWFVFSTQLVWVSKMP